MDQSEKIPSTELHHLITKSCQENKLLEIEMKTLETILSKNPDLKNSYTSNLKTSEWIDIYDEEREKYQSELLKYKEYIEEDQTLMLEQLEYLDFIKEWQQDQQRSFEREVLHFHGKAIQEKKFAKPKASETLTSWYHHQEAAKNAIIAKFYLSNDYYTRHIDALSKKLLLQTTSGQEAHHRVDYEVLQIKQGELTSTLLELDNKAMEEKATLSQCTDQLKQMQQDLDLKWKEQEQLKSVIASHLKRGKDRHQNIDESCHNATEQLKNQKVFETPCISHYMQTINLIQNLQHQIQSFEKKIQLAQFESHQ